MERLKDRVADDAVARAAARLIRASAVEEPPVGLEQRIRARLLAARPRRARLRLSPALAIVLALALAGVAAAAAHRWIRRSPAPTAPASASAHPLRASLQTAPAPTAQSTSVAAPASPAAAPRLLPATNRPAPRHANALPARAADSQFNDARAADSELNDARETTTPAATAAAPSAAASTARPLTTSPAQAPTPERPRADVSESRLVLDGATALRRQHDPAGAIKLLDQYLRRYPNGALIEEGLALAIEARSMRGDRKAATLANEYLRRFPTGRFHDEARRAIERFNRDR